MPVSALQNPNDRRRINKIARLAVKAKATNPAEIRAAVKTWLEESKKPKKQRSAAFQRGDGKAAMKHIASGQAKKQTASQKAQYARVRREVAKSFAALGEGYGPSRGRRGRKVSYAGRAVAAKASRYKLQKATKSGPAKVEKDKRGRRIVSKSGTQHWTKNRAGRRGQDRWGKVVPWVPLAEEGKRRPAKSKRGGPGTAFSAAYPEAFARASGGSAPRGKKSKKNPFGALALSNSGAGVLGGTVGVVQHQALPLALGLATGAGVHAAAVVFDVPGRVSERVPFLANVLEGPAAYTAQGLLVGIPAIAAGLAVRGTAGSYLLSTSVSAIAFGVATDFFNFVVDRFGGGSDSSVDAELDELGDLALTNGFGDLALTNTSALGGVGFGDGMAYQTASLSASGVGDYAQSNLADAMYSGADFSSDEGAALVNGRESWMRRFGGAPHRVSVTGRGSGPSHLAGREGHRWGWLIKTVGWEKAQEICALAPAKRVAILKKMRETALATFNQEMAAASAAASTTAALPAAGTVATGAFGAESNFLGEPALFAGA
jgi:hypothetical protein